MTAISVGAETSFEAYLAMDEGAEPRLELFRGRVFEMMSASGTHVVVQANLARMCGTALRGKPCRFVGENAKVHVPRKGSGYHPDGTIACPLRFSNEAQGVVENPQVVFEILSPGTERFDRTDKWDDYATIESVREIVLIETEAARVEIYERREDGWLKRVYLAGTAARVPSIGLELALDELYEDATPAPIPS
ncbi:Uma2 family endonuclease [bacterium]|nr:MAG: Uma2 family endonuclease [bacterium]